MKYLIMWTTFQILAFMVSFIITNRFSNGYVIIERAIGSALGMWLFYYFVGA